MIRPEAIQRRAEGQFKQVLRAWLEDDEPFPKRYGTAIKRDELQDWARLREGIQALKDHVSRVNHPGYRLEEEQRNTRQLGEQTLPTQVVIEDWDAYLALVQRRRDFQRFTEDVARIRQRLPALNAWMIQHPMHIIEHQGHWDDLLTVCEFFLAHPQPGVYSRELPIPVHTKFIESHTKILSALLDALLPETAINAAEKDFEPRFGLLQAPSLLRLRLLDAQLQTAHGLPLDDLTLPVAQVDALLTHHLQPSRVIIVENEIPFLTLPALPEGVAFFGSGYAAARLGQLEGLQRCEVLYWGDVDAHGFQILSELREQVPHTRSVMMDWATYQQHGAFLSPEPDLKRKTPFAHLTAAEKALAEHILSTQRRLEQEHIPHAAAVNSLRELWSAATA